jgi:hypothetical protein
VSAWSDSYPHPQNTQNHSPHSPSHSMTHIPVRQHARTERTAKVVALGVALALAVRRIAGVAVAHWAGLGMKNARGGRRVIKGYACGHKDLLE